MQARQAVPLDAVPGGQTVHCAALPTLTVPGVHGLHAAEEAGEIVPAGQGTQLAVRA